MNEYSMFLLCLFCLAKNECHHQAKVGCDHFCYPGSNSYRCSCADGYELGKDEKQCVALGRCEHAATGGTCSELGWAGHHLTPGISLVEPKAVLLGRKRNLGTTTQDAKVTVKGLFDQNI